jgi:dTDP-4-dehydrorhamnose reductase
MTRVLVTGASGLLGANLVLAWMEKHAVTAVTHTTRLAHPNLEARQADLSAPGEARRLFREARPEAVVHCAAAADVDACERDPASAFRLNREMAGEVAQAAYEAGARLVHISTDAVFDGRAGPYREVDLPSPVNVYAESKLAGEAAVQRAHPEALILRTNFFGWNALPKRNLAEFFLEKLRAGEEAPGFTDVFFSPLLVNDLAGLILSLLASDAAGVLHVGGRECLSKYDFGRRLARQFGFDEARLRPTTQAMAGQRAPRALRVCLDSSRLASRERVALPGVDEGLARLRALEAEGYTQDLRRLIQAPREGPSPVGGSG